MAPKTLADLFTLLSSLVAQLGHATVAALADLLRRYLVASLEWSEQQIEEIRGSISWGLAFALRAPAPAPDPVTP